MTMRLNTITARVNEIHEYLILNKKIDDVDYVLDYVENYEYMVKEQYLVFLCKYYFHDNNIENFKELLSLGYKFDLSIKDIELAFLNITVGSGNVIEILEDNILFFKDINYANSLEIMYKHYQNVNDELKLVLDNVINLLKKNNYICAFCYKNRNLNFCEFFLDKDILNFLKKDLPFLLK